MKTKSSILIFSFLLLFLAASCSPKIPKPSDPSNGLLVVLLEGKSDEVRNLDLFIWKYGFYDGDKEVFLAKIQKRKHFLAKELKAGSYNIDTFKMKSSQSGDVVGSVSDMVTKLKYPFNVKIEPGKVTIFPLKVGSQIKSNGMVFGQYPDLVDLKPEMIDEYMDMLKKAPNFDQWEFQADSKKDYGHKVIKLDTSNI